MKYLYAALLICTFFSIESLAQVSFTDASSQLPSTKVSDHCVGVCDMNGDGLDDIIRNDEGEAFYLAIQNSGGGFTEEFLDGMDVPGTGSANAWGIAAADLDGNGINDLVSGGFYNGVYIFKGSTGASTWDTDIELMDEIYVQGISIFDIDNDGELDIFLCDDLDISQILTNTGNGNFAELSSGLIPESDQFSDNSGNYGSCFSDIDNNGHADLYIAKCKQGEQDPNAPTRINLLFLNNGDGTWTSGGQAANLDIGAQSWSADFGDIDNDGDMDAFIGNHDVPSQLLINDGNGVFTDVTVAAGMGDAFQYLVIQTTWVDLDNDGFIDLLAMGNGDHTIAWNNGDGTFTIEQNAFSGYTTNSFALGDLNEDGFVDVYSTANGYGGWDNESINDALFLNNGNNNRYLRVTLQGTDSNPNGVGARITVFTSENVSMIRDVKAGESYGIQHSLTQHFGLGEAEFANVIVEWPSGEFDQFFFDPDQTVTLIEGSGVSSILESNLADFTVYPNPAVDFLQIQIDDPHVDCLEEYSILDALGRVIQSGTIVNRISTRDLATGDYRLLLHGEDGIVGISSFIKR